jgi:peptidoglycan/xylan/chitin deacetylase (PgdA/CDA1 family)
MSEQNNKRPENRFDFSAMPHRDKLVLPEGKRMAVYTVVNVEEWDIEKPIAREYVTSPAGVKTVPNMPNWAWHEYGMRVGIWRLLDFFNKHNLKATTAINATVLSGKGEPVAAAMREAGWEFMGHGFHQAALHTVENQVENITNAFNALKAYTGKAPKGWLGPGLHETLDTLDYLAECGFKYVCDLPMDEQPVSMKTTSSDIVAMPYTMELSDLPMMVVHCHESHVWYDRVVDQFDRLYEESSENPRIMSMSIHPYIMGVPHRIKHFEKAYEHMLKKDDVWFCTAEEIYDWFASQK